MTTYRSWSVIACVSALLALAGCGKGLVGDVLDAGTDAVANPCQGQADGTVCGDSSGCDSSTCLGGACVASYQPAGTLCGDAASDECTNPDTCDGAGTCLANHAPPGLACGDPSTSECSNPDTCDGAGTCSSNDRPAGLACGDSTDNGECILADTCDGAGACSSNDKPEGAPCGDPTQSECTSPDTCDATGSCLGNDQPAGALCGDPTSDECTSPDTCNGTGTCLANHAPVGATCGSRTNNACTDPDSCDGAGACLDNDAPAGTACGNATDNACTDPDTCSGAGTCLANHAPAGTLCGDPSNTECTDPDTCSGAGACLANHAVEGLVCTDCATGTCQGCTSGVCLDTCDDPYELATTFAGGNGQAGNMFDVSSTTRAITIEGFDVNLIAGTHTVEIYYKAGSYVGFDTDATAWTLAASVPNVNSLAIDTPTSVPVTLNIVIPAGQTYGLYVTTNDGSMRYTNGTTEGAPYASDGHIVVFEGLGKAYPFADSFTPRVFNGNIYYRTTCP
jgi:hypothetical protein